MDRETVARKSEVLQISGAEVMVFLGIAGVTTSAGIYVGRLSQRVMTNTTDIGRIFKRLDAIAKAVGANEGGPDAR